REFLCINWLQQVINTVHPKCANGKLIVSSSEYYRRIDVPRFKNIEAEPVRKLNIRQDKIRRLMSLKPLLARCNRRYHRQDFHVGDQRPDLLFKGSCHKNLVFYNQNSHTRTVRIQNLGSASPLQYLPRMSLPWYEYAFPSFPRYESHAIDKG